MGPLYLPRVGEGSSWPILPVAHFLSSYVPVVTDGVRMLSAKSKHTFSLILFLSSLPGCLLSGGKLGGFGVRDNASFSSLAAISADGDYSKYKIADGYDALAGISRASCLDKDKTTIRTYQINQGTDTLYLVSSKSEMAEKLGVNTNLELSGTKGDLNGSLTSKLAILSESQVTSGSYTAIAEYKYIKDEISVYNSVPEMNPEMVTLLQKSGPLAFRQMCGDKFYKSLKTGASLYLVFKAEKITENNHRQVDVENSLNVALGSIFGLKGSAQVNYDQKKILQNFRISSKCYSEGTSAHPCADNMLNSPAIDLDETNKAIVDAIKSAKMALANDIDSKNNIVVVSENLADYDVPALLASKRHNEVFYDYKPNLNTLQAWLKMQERVQNICAKAPNSFDLCEQTNKFIAKQMELCALQRFFDGKSCRLPTQSDVAPVMGMNDAGTVTFFEHGKAQGRSVTLMFDDIYGIKGDDTRLLANTIYNIRDDRFGVGMEDILSNFNSMGLKKGWQVAVFEHADGQGRKYIVKPGLNLGHFGPDGFNDLMSSFRLERDPM